MIATEFMNGQGFGNQLFCYIVTRCLAIKNNYYFGTINQELFGAPRWKKKGVYFMNLDLGYDINLNEVNKMAKYTESEIRYYNDSCLHDSKYGCDIRLYDTKLLNIEDNDEVANDAGEAHERIYDDEECNIDDIEPTEPEQDKAPEPTEPTEPSVPSNEI